VTNRLRCAASLLTLSICCYLPAHAQSCAPAPSGLVSWWTADTNENDVVGGNNPQAVQAVSLVPGEIQNGFKFGTQGYIEIPAAPSLANQQFTWTAWARPDGPGPNNDSYGSVILQQNISATSAVVNLLWRATDGRFLFLFGYQYTEMILSTDAFATGNFYLVTATYDGATFKLFVNGVLEGSFPEAKTIGYTSLPWTIGSSDPQYFPSFARTWNGVIDEVQAYNRALSLSEIQTLYNAGSAGVCKGLTFTPTSLKFARQTLGATSTPQTLTATNVFPLAVTVQQAGTNGDFAETNNCPVPPATLAPGASCTASVTFTPTTSGPRSGKFGVLDSAPASPQYVSLTGSATDIGLSASHLYFGSQPVGTTSTAKVVTVTNEGSVTVNFTGSGIVLAGTDPADFLISANTCGPSLAAGASCTVRVKFQPMATGSRGASLQFNDDGGASPQTVKLSGSGT